MLTVWALVEVCPVVRLLVLDKSLDTHCYIADISVTVCLKLALYRWYALSDPVKLQEDTLLTD